MVEFHPTFPSHTQVPRRAWDRSPYWSGWGRWWTDATEGSLPKCNWVKLGRWFCWQRNSWECLMSEFFKNMFKKAPVLRDHVDLFFTQFLILAEKKRPRVSFEWLIWTNVYIEPLKFPGATSIHQDEAQKVGFCCFAWMDWTRIGWDVFGNTE